MLRTKLAFALLFVFCGGAFAQEAAARNETQSKQTPASCTCDFHELYRRDGWTVPGLKRAKPIGKRIELRNIPGVFVQRLRRGDNQFTLAGYECSPDHIGRLEIVEFPIAVGTLVSFDVGGRVFAYWVHYGREKFDEHGRRRDAGAESDVIFYDLEGAGRFTLARWPPEVPLPEFIPDWVKKEPSPSAK